MTNSKEIGKGENSWSIDFNTLPYKIHFFLFLGATSAILPYMVIFCNWKFSLSGSELAVIFATQQFLTALTKPAIGAIVDRFNKMKLALITLILLKMIFFFSLLFIPGTETILSVQDNQHGYSISFTLDCEPVTEDGMSCQLKETICYSLQQSESEVNNSSGEECLAHDVVHGLDLCTYGAFSCCGSNEEFVRHRFKNESLKCQKLAKESNSQIASVFGDDCIRFIASKSDKFSRVQGYAFPISSEIDITKNDDNNNNETFFLCTHKIVTRNKAAKTDIFLRTNEKSFLCRANYITDPYCSALGDLASIASCQLRSNSSIDLIQCKRNERKPISWTYNKYIFTFLLLGATICLHSLFNLSDTACHESIQKFGGDYGKQRVWGTLAFGLLSPLTGLLNDLATKVSSRPDYVPGFCIFGVLSGLEIANMMRLDLAKPNLRGSVFKQVGTLFKSPSFVLFEFGTLMNGFFISVIWFYQLLFLETIGSSKLLMGLVLAVQCILGELPFVYFSSCILRRIGYMNALVFTFLCFALRFIWLHLLYNPWWVLPVEITHGVSYGLFYAAMTSFAKSSAPKGAEATTQSLLGSTYTSLGAGLGCMVTGICFDHLGSRRTFLVFSLLSLAVALIQFVGSMCLKRRSKSIQSDCELELKH